MPDIKVPHPLVPVANNITFLNDSTGQMRDYVCWWRNGLANNYRLHLRYFKNNENCKTYLYIQNALCNSNNQDSS